MRRRPIAEFALLVGAYARSGTPGTDDHAQLRNQPGEPIIGIVVPSALRRNLGIAAPTFECGGLWSDETGTFCWAAE